MSSGLWTDVRRAVKGKLAKDLLRRRASQHRRTHLSFGDGSQMPTHHRELERLPTAPCAFSAIFRLHRRVCHCHEVRPADRSCDWCKCRTSLPSVWSSGFAAPYETDLASLVRSSVRSNFCMAWRATISSAPKVFLPRRAMGINLVFPVFLISEMADASRSGRLPAGKPVAPPRPVFRSAI